MSSEEERTRAISRPTQHGQSQDEATRALPRRGDSGRSLATSYEVPLMPGDTLGGYEIAEQLGKGAMAWVYVAYAPDGKQVALKVIRLPPAELNDSLVERFLREGEILEKIQHPNVVQLLGRGYEEGTWRAYLVLEYVPGTDLLSLLKRRQRLGIRPAMFVLDRCAKGILAAHALGILHRDVKPANVLVTPHGEVKLADFGISLYREHQRLTARDEVVGTLPYLAPEVVAYGNWSPAADMYALGCLTYRLLTGELPFKANNPKELLRKQREEPAPAVSQLTPDPIPRAVDELVDWLLAKSPQRRPTAGQLVTFLAEEELVPGGRSCPDLMEP